MHSNGATGGPRQRGLYPRTGAPVGTTNGSMLNRVRFPDEGGASGSSQREETALLDSVFDIVTAVLAMICVAGVSTILIVLYVTVRPFSQRLYRRLVAQLGAAAFLDALALLLPNTKIYLTGDSDVPSSVGTSLMVSNHLVCGDWWAIFMLTRCIGLRGSVKVFLRNEYLHANVGDASSSSTTTTKLVVANGTAATQQRNNSSSPQDLALLAKLLHLFLEFPLMNGDDRNHMFQLLRSFADNDDWDGGAGSAPVQLLFFPEGWCLHNDVDRQSMLQRSNEFANREGRPQLRHLLYPRTRGFNASLECLREATPTVYDVTMASRGYDGSLPPFVQLSSISLWHILRHKFPKEIHIRCKKYSMEEVLQDSSWLDKKWVEKDRMLAHFCRHHCFPVDGDTAAIAAGRATPGGASTYGTAHRSSRGMTPHYRGFDSRQYSLESSIVALIRLLILPFFVPMFLLLSVPLVWTLFWMWVANRVFGFFFPTRHRHGHGGGSALGSRDGYSDDDSRHRGEADQSQTPGSTLSGGTTPYLPATPFASPSLTSWREMFSANDHSSTS